MGTGGLLYLGRTKTTYSNKTGSQTIQTGVVPLDRYYLVYVHLITVNYTGPMEFVEGIFGYKITTPYGESSDTEIINGGVTTASLRSGLIVVGPGETYSVSTTATGFMINSMAVYVEEFAAQTY
nr:hypothetical protein CKG001_10310 [Bdellovibrio sp. CKG001]